ncbi:hypothetical protein [Mesoflavibacter sp. CH_XMU1422-2]|uniref:hypothetical protein n=1 Tax=Mesoflavibacter sp. CH_XMU1422-2 TaxID=3107770 RepID=UPI00300B3564
MKQELQEVLSIIEQDEYYDSLSKYLKRTLYIIADLIDYYDDGCSYESLEMLCVQSGISQTQYLSDLIKLLFLGYITRNDANKESENFTIGSTRIYNQLHSEYCKEKYEKIKIEKINHLKLWLHSKINSIKGESYLTRYKGRTIEDIFKNDPDYIIEKIQNGNFILSLSTIEILENRYKYQFPDNLKERLINYNEEYLKKEKYLIANKKKKHQILPIKNNNLEYKNRMLEKQNFMMSLDKSKYKYELINDRINILGNFYWDNESKLIDDLSINGNLKISNFLEKPKIIPRGLKVSGYIQFGTFTFKEEDETENSFDVWLKLE